VLQIAGAEGEMAPAIFGLSVQEPAWELLQSIAGLRFPQPFPARCTALTINRMGSAFQASSKGCCAMVEPARGRFSALSRGRLEPIVWPVR